MLESTPSLQRLIDELRRLPGIGRKTATRLAFFILQQPEHEVRNLAQALADVKQNVSLCGRCFNITETDPCQICRAQERDDTIVCVVEQPQDLLAIERGHDFHGRYHVLHGVLSPLDGIGPDNLRIPQLLLRLEQSRIAEVLVATNFSMEGEATALYLSKILQPLGVKVTRLAHGIPMGGDLEYLDAATLSGAIAHRQQM
ncbi:MAG: recombination mediator RecR [Desulfuromonadaceae bacterium]|nr:recombination mediator RecR [Desulfuromonadaceae bacterium]